METLFVYLGKSSGLIALFYLAYYLILQKETFFNSNRWFLLAGLITSTLLPLLFFTKIIWVNPSPTNLNWSKLSVTTPIENESFEINWYLIFGIVYGIGIVLFLLKLVFDLYSLSKILKGKTIQKQADFKFIDVTENISPFSYLNYIVYNSSLYSESELENILEHEKVHSSQVHTADVLISRLFCIAFWFNPFVWLYKKAIDQNLEFIADSEASKNSSDKKAYQLTLLKITTQENCVALTNHFYQSLIKKRIVMLNKNQSKKRNSWKFAFVLPLLGAFVFFFQVKVVAQDKKMQEHKTVEKLAIIKSFYITKETTDETINSEVEKFKKEFKTDVVFSKIKRNTQGEIITLKVDITCPNQKTNSYQSSNYKVIKPLLIFLSKKKNSNEIVGFSISSEIMTSKNFRLYDSNGLYEMPTPPPPPKTPRPTKEIVKAKIDVKQTYKYAIQAKIDRDQAKTDAKQAKTDAIQAKIDRDQAKKDSEQAKTDVLQIKIESKPIIIINGKINEASMEDINKLDPNLIQSMNILKGKNATEKYGKNGENGAIEIITKENLDILKSSNKKVK